MSDRAPGATFRDDELDLECTFFGQHPVQGEGYVMGYPSYFRAKWNFWHFTVCVSHKSSPVIATLIDPPNDETGFFECGEYRGYMETEYFGTGLDASTMPLHVAEAIVRACAHRCLDALTSGDGGRGP